LKEYKVAFIFTDEYHTPVEGKSYQIGSKEPISATSKPIILYFWMDDYVREWDKGSPKLYEDQHGSVIESLKWDGKNLNLSILDYATFSQEEYNFSVGSECITPDNIVQENDYTSPYLITPTKIIVTDKIMDIVKEPLGIALREKLEGVWKGADKFTKVAENENFSAEYNACSSCKDSVLGLAAESSCSECAETFDAEDIVCPSCGSDNWGEQEGYSCRDCDHVFNPYPQHAESFESEVEELFDCSVCDKTVYENDNPQDDELCDGCLETHKQCSVCQDYEPYNEMTSCFTCGQNYCGSCDKYDSCEVYDAETFNVEFNDWADQEMNSHGKDISFNDWSKDEGLKHGNTEITDWAQHEDESHDARYEAETFASHGEPCSQCENGKMFFTCGECGFIKETKHHPLYYQGAETYESEGDIICIKCRDSKEELEKIGEFLYFTKDGMICQPCAEDYAIHYDSPYCECDNCYSTKHKNAETFEANAKTGNKVYIITRRGEDYSANRELDMAGFGSLTEARKKFNLLFKEAKEQDYADETIADAKDYMSWGEYWGVMSFNNGEMIYELREVIVGNKGDFYFDAESFEEEDHYYDLIWDIPPRHRGEDYDAYYKHIENKSMSFEDIKDYLIKNKNKITPKLDKSPSNESNECSQCSEVIATYCPQCHESYCKDCYEEYRHWFDIRLKGQSGYGDEKSEIILKDVCWDNFEYGIFNNSPLSKGE